MDETLRVSLKGIGNNKVGRIDRVDLSAIRLSFPFYSYIMIRNNNYFL